MKGKFGLALSAFVLCSISAELVGFSQIPSPPSGIIRTIAGNGVLGFSGDGEVATEASLNWMLGIATDLDGNIYIADSGNFRIRKVMASTGQIVTVAGNGSAEISGDNGPATQAGLGSPVAVAVDVAKNIYILTTTRVRKVSGSDATISTIVGGAGGGYSGDGGPASAAQIEDASGLAIDALGNLYIADSGNNRVRTVSASSGKIDTIVGNGQPGFSGDGGPAIQAELNHPYSVAVDRNGNVFVADYGNCRVRRLSLSSGVLNTIAGTDSCGFSGDGGSASGAELGEVLGVAVDSRGNVYLADSGNQRVRMIDVTTGIISTIAGNGSTGFEGDNGPATSAELETVYGLTVDPTGYLYILSSAVGRVRAVGPGAAQNPSSYTVLVSSSDPGPRMGEAVVLKATVTSNLGLPAIAGSVTWYLGTLKIGESNVDSDGLASFVTTLAAAGDQTITAIFDGIASGSGSVTLPVSGFTLGLGNSSVTVASGQNAQIKISAAALHDFEGSVDLNCSGLPYPGFCTLSSGTVNFTRSTTQQSVTLTLKTANSLTMAANHTSVAPTLALVSIGSFILIGFRTRRLFQGYFPFAPLFLVLGFTMALSGCGSASPRSGSSSGSQPQSTVLPAGTYGVIVTASSGNESAQLPITVTVQ